MGISFIGLFLRARPSRMLRANSVGLSLSSSANLVFGLGWVMGGREVSGESVRALVGERGRMVVVVRPT